MDLRFNMKLSIFQFLKFLFLVFLLSCSTTDSTNFSATGGLLDLRNYEKFSTNSIDLNGEWEFHWNEFIVSNNQEKTNDIGQVFIKTQESWEGKIIQDISIPREGFASYKLKVLLPETLPLESLWIQIPSIASSYRFYANEMLLHNSGVASSSSTDSKGYIKPQIVEIKLSPKQKDLTLVFEIANYQNESPGFWQIPKLGIYSIIFKKYQTAIGMDLFFFGILFIMGFYHLGIYFFHRSEKSILFFALFSFLIATRTSLTGERFIMDLLPGVEWEYFFRLEFLSFFLLPISFLILIQELFPKESNFKLTFLLLLIHLFFAGLTFFPVAIFTKFAPPFLLVLISVLLISLYIILKAYIRKRPDTGLLLLGIILFLFSVAWDVGRDFLNLRGFTILPFGFLAFVFSQALVLSSRLAYHFAKSKALTESLRITNEELMELKDKLEEKVKDRTSELNASLKLIHRDLAIAKKIQGKIIPGEMISRSDLEVQYLYKPQDEVGGDIFDISEINKDRIRIFLADALGHGIQAALLTLVIRSEYENFKLLHSPADCLKNFSDQFHTKFHSLNTYYSAVVIDIIFSEQKLIYASAGHPNQILWRDGKLEEITQTARITGFGKDIQVKERELPFPPGSRMFLFTDGLFEQFNEEREIFGEERIQNIVLNQSNLSLSSIMAETENQLSRFLVGNKAQDDITFVAIERK